jgi:hypothetical protein
VHIIYKWYSQIWNKNVEIKYILSWKKYNDQKLLVLEIESDNNERRKYCGKHESLYTWLNSLTVAINFLHYGPMNNWGIYVLYNNPYYGHSIPTCVNSTTWSKWLGPGGEKKGGREIMNVPALLEKWFIVTPRIHYWCRLVTVVDTNNGGLTTRYQ